ncbi:ACP S-malonyltransferase [Streptomyces sp. NRRL S-646]|uniref:ACP S-malonyltransferase n=1 Tax=Streptomyces sp. NRRL S-646 TaxID=1463917 RepID=UPI0004C67397|nr:ACP S-malonyltransferase [Streptomyces sp. NRRL S-646]
MRARIFPGQGAQRKGMGDGVFGDFPELTAQADELLGYSITELCLEDPEGKLRQTRYAQPAIYFTNALLHLSEHGEPAGFDYFAGHSLGEYNALVAAGMLDLMDGLDLVRGRAEAMAGVTGGAMLAVIGLSRNQVESLLLSESVAAVYIANWNSDQQIVVAGDRSGIRAFGKEARKSGATKVAPLSVSGPFHTPLMNPARIEFDRALARCAFKPGDVPVVSSTTGELVDPVHLRNLLSTQISSPVQWVTTVRTLREFGVTRFSEVNGTTLTKLDREID